MGAQAEQGLAEDAPGPAGTGTWLGTTSTRQPAASAEAAPVGESSMATVARVEPSSSAGVQVGLGVRLAVLTSSPETTTSKDPVGQGARTGATKRRYDIVTRAHGTSRSRSSASSSRAPGRQGTDCSTCATTPSSSTSTISCGVRSMPLCSRM